MPDGARARLQDALGYEFGDGALLQTALTHSSYAAEHSAAEPYERLEFLGDAVLALAVTRYLYEHYPELSEGEMAKVRAAIVDESTLAATGRSLGVPAAIRLGRGEEQSGGRDKDSIIADVMEALIGCVFLEAGFPVAERMVLDLWSSLAAERAVRPGRRDYKTRLQEVLAVDQRRPEYVVTAEGPEHAKRFTAAVLLDGVELGSGEGTSKKRAEAAAARAALDRLEAGD